jgi:2-oxoglutarate dehydrogenase E1 component
MVLSGASSAYLEDLYERFLRDPRSLDSGWRAFFAGLKDGNGHDALTVARTASWGRPILVPLEDDIAARVPPADVTRDARQAALDSIRARLMIRAFRVRGHLGANLDPLGLAGGTRHPDLDPASYGFAAADHDRPIFLDGTLGPQAMTLREVMVLVNEIYCGSIGYEYMHIQSLEQRDWLQVRIEAPEYRQRYSPRTKRAILRQLTEAETFERFLAVKYTGTKRFGLDGAESLLAALESILDRAVQHGVEEVVFGMPHRGRLNVLANIVKKPVTAILSEFEGVPSMPGDVQGSGDIKYHLGTSADRDIAGKRMHVSLAANPSHLEAVDPVVLGKVRAKQQQRDDAERKRVMAILMHGDAAFAGQGIVAECLGLSELRGYRVGGTVHVIVNNQIGFTTSPRFARSSPYPSDVALSVQAPILHVNGDDPEAVIHVAKIATDFRHKFGKDVVIDLFCYRRFGHNEADEPSFTQPIMYRKIAAHPSTRQLYAKQLVAEGVLTDADADAMVADIHARLEQDHKAARSYRPNKADWLEGRWLGLKRPAGAGARAGTTSVAVRDLMDLAEPLTHIPATFDAHPTVRRIYARRRETLLAGTGIDWATAESLAFATLLREGFQVRLSGQDSARGTFSHRHAVLVSQNDESRYVPLEHLEGTQGSFEVIDSMLSEEAVLGFEYGYSLAEPNGLILWEAQFGDFANGAQVMFDQFLASAESKWLRMSGLVALLPHGQEGQGPEHSSARVERYLQLCAEDNLQVVVPTTPASYFHLLRRQVHRDFRKPLVVMAPKSLLRHKRAVSNLADMGHGRTFHRVLWDDDAALRPDRDIRRVVLCSGKVYYDLLEAKEASNVHDVYVLRLEQLYPFPGEPLSEELARFPKAEVMWCQEEPKNAGAWLFARTYVEELLTRLQAGAPRIRYAGPPAMAAPAPGSLKQHQALQAQIVAAALAA